MNKKLTRLRRHNAKISVLLQECSKVAFEEAVKKAENLRKDGEDAVVKVTANSYAEYLERQKPYEKLKKIEIGDTIVVLGISFLRIAAPEKVFDDSRSIVCLKNLETQEEFGALHSDNLLSRVYETYTAEKLLYT